MAGSLTLVANPGSASRKYALYDGARLRTAVHFEWKDGRIVCGLGLANEQMHEVPVSVETMEAAAGQVPALLQQQGILRADESINRIGLRVVAPGAYFLQDRIIDDAFAAALEAAKQLAPLHVTAALEELYVLRRQFSGTPIVGVSDSAFHQTKPDYAWNYGIPLAHADQFDVKRFGYHGLSVASTVRQLHDIGKLAPKMVVCHIGSGVSVTAVHGGVSVDTTMGFSPLEGPVMATRSGSIDLVAVRTLQSALGLSDSEIEIYLNTKSGLAGLGGSSDMRELLRREAEGNASARLAIATYVLSLQKAIGQMVAALGGVDSLVFTGTIGERSSAIRQRVLRRLLYLDFVIDEQANDKDAHGTRVVSRLAHSRPVFVVPADENGQIALQTGHALAAQ